MDDSKYLPELMAEKDSLDPSFVHATRLVTAGSTLEKVDGFRPLSESRILHSTESSLKFLVREITKIEAGEASDEEKFVDVVSNKNMKLAQKVLIPVKQFPKFNFVGKLLGPRGNSLKRLQEETLTKMSILGKGSMRDKAKDYNDEIRQQQLQELSYLNGTPESPETPAVRGKPVRGRGALAPALSRGRGGVPPPTSAVPRAGPVPRGAPPGRGPGARGRGVPAPRARGAPGYRPPPPPVQDTTYGEYAYGDGYGTTYEDQGYDSYDNNYSNQGQSASDYYDYGHGTSQETYEPYGQEEWTNSNSRMKAPPARAPKGAYREHPYPPRY
ncbi:KH domain-containing, RNA-binding, signal transduction-associated protein 3-like isoform X7 [Scyliorhinus torazame]|uniref:KH domain-containing, RNA-binding, signal transduction-associated protein 3-like isoform X7 n=1 Tax=Scyliorhinus torazame TaxID=75743 RepID=UPI003B5A8811